MEFHSVSCYILVVVEMVISLENIPRIQGTGENNTNFKNHVCSYYNSQFLCKDKRKCIDLIDTCNGECNCMDCSDESDQCWKHDEYFCQTCYHLCLPTPDGPQCLCDTDNYKDTRICKEIEECGPDTACNQRCVKYEGVERCTCDENYSARPHTIGRSCKSDFPQGNLLLYSTENKLKVFHFYTGKTSLVQKNVDCKGLSAAGDYCYHGAVEKDTGYVFRTSIINGQTDLGFETYSPIIFSIDVDWITGNVYFSTDQSLSVCSKHGYLCAQIKSLINLTDSCYIALAPRSGLLFHSLRSLYIKHEHSRIMKSSMDGSAETVLVSVGLLHPVSLTVDESSQKVYWLDKDYSEIESIQFNGKNRKVWFSDPTTNFFAITELENDFFWTRENINSIGLNAVIYSKFITDNDTRFIEYLYAYNPLLQTTKIRNPCRKASCNGLCLLRQSPTKQLDFTCLCTDFTPSNGNHWCNKQSAPYDWQFETDSEYEIQPPSTHSEGKMNSAVVYGFLIILAIVSVCLIFRHRIVYYFERVFNRRHVDRNEYIEL